MQLSTRSQSPRPGTLARRWLWLSGCTLLLLSQGLWAEVLVAHDPANSSHAEVFAALRRSLAEAPGQAPGRDTVAWDITRESAPPAPLGNPGHDPELIVTIGTKAAAAVARLNVAVPVLNALIPKAAYDELHADSSPRHAAVYLDQPLDRQFAVARALLPDAHRSGVLLDADNREVAAQAAAQARRFDFDLELVTMQAADDPAERIERLIDVSDLIIAVYDPAVFHPATAKWLLYLAFQERRPIVGFSQALLKAGAIAAVYSTPAQIGRHAGERVRDWLQRGGPLAGAEYPRYFDIGVNAPVAEALGILLEDTVELEARVRAAGVPVP